MTPSAAGSPRDAGAALLVRIAGFGGAVCISFSAIFVRLADVAPLTAAFFRTAYAVPILALVVLIRREKANRRLRLVGFASGFFLALDLLLWHNAIDLIGAGLATVLTNIQVVFVGLAAWMIHRERPTSVAFAVVPVIFLGVALVSGLGREDSFGADPVVGALFGVGAGAAYTGFLLLYRQVGRLAPSRLAGTLLDASAGAALGSVLLGLFDPDFTLEPSWPEHGWLLALAFLAQVVGWLAIGYALPRMPALDTSVILLLQPALTIVWARLIFTEVLSLVQWMGVVVVLAGVAGVAGRSAAPADATVTPVEVRVPPAG